MVERWFAELTNKQIRRGVHRSTRALEDAIRNYLGVHTADSDDRDDEKDGDECIPVLP